MPEGPEIRRAADELAAALAGQVVEEVFFGLPALEPWAARLAGQRVARVEPRGKGMLIVFDGGLTLFSHNQLYGRWQVVARGECPQTTRALRLGLHTARASCLLWSASLIQVLRPEELARHPFLARLGPDVLSAESTAESVLARYRSAAFRARRLGGLLLDQGFLAGIGNYLRSEILFVAGVDAQARPQDLSAEECAALARATVETAQQAYRTGGVTSDMALFRRLVAEGADPHGARFWVFDREGQPCHRCGTPVQRVTAASRRLYHCTVCQGAGRRRACRQRSRR